MSQAYRLSCPSFVVKGHIDLASSKSISNRALIIQSLCRDKFNIERISTSDDTKVLQAMLASEEDNLYSGYAGTSYRFMVARACLGKKPVTIDAAPPLRKRPIGPLVNALRELGAGITYTGKEGFPPVRIDPDQSLGKNTHEIKLHAGISSQYVSALLMIAPLMPEGLILHLDQEAVSIPYIEMTLAMLKYFGIEYSWQDNVITVQPGEYKARDITIEGDWSSASYYYSMVALAAKAAITIDGLSQDSLQGDAIVRDIYKQLGVNTTYTESGVLLQKDTAYVRPDKIEYDFLNCPDLAQTICVTLAGLGIRGELSGLKTLRIKETDRIAALQNELAKIKTSLEVIEKGENIEGVLHGKAKWKDKAKFDTYEDHRMAMAFAPLGVLNPIIIKEPDVVKKSYPDFWKDISKIGIKIDILRGKV